MSSLILYSLFATWITITFTKHPTIRPTPTSPPTPANLTSHVVSINQKTGENEPDCVISNKTCKDLHYAFYTTLARNSVFNIITLKIYGDYVLKEAFGINSTDKDLKALHIMGADKYTKLTSSSSYVSINIGFNRTGYDVQFLPYSVSFTNLNVSGFGSEKPAAVIGWYVKNVTIYDSIFIDNKCAALNLLNTPVEIQGCLFQNNSVNVRHLKRKYTKKAFPFGSASAGGAVGLIYNQISKVNVALLHDNKFINNRGEAYHSKSVAQTSDSKYMFSKSGGALILAVIDGFYNEFNVFNNQFIHNSAALGGAMMISNHATSASNHYYVDNCTFHANRASSTGGGLSFSNWDSATDNNMKVSNSKFTANQARVAGGMKILFQSQLSAELPGEQMVFVEDVIFEYNRANVASGIHMIYNLAIMGAKPTLPVTITNSIFAHHSLGFQDIGSGPSAYSGVVLTNRLDLMFNGHNQWYNNSFESPLYASNAEVHVDGNLTFANNMVQTSGGGITLSDVAHMVVHPGANLVFVDNYAHVKGGAMFVKTVGFPEMVYKYNPSCFIQYLDRDHPGGLSPDEWKVRFI